MYRHGNFVLVAVLTVIFLLVTGCQKIENNTSEEKIWNFNQSNISVEDFRKLGKFWTNQNEIDQMIKDGLIGNSPDNPIVPIGFDENGFLYTNEKFNKEILSSINPSVEGWTDLETFSKVTNSPYATSAYSDIIGEVWVFDAFVKFFTTREEKNKQVEEKYKLLPSI